MQLTHVWQAQIVCVMGVDDSRLHADSLWMYVFFGKVTDNNRVPQCTTVVRHRVIGDEIPAGVSGTFTLTVMAFHTQQQSINNSVTVAVHVGG